MGGAGGGLGAKSVAFLTLLAAGNGFVLGPKLGQRSAAPVVARPAPGWLTAPAAPAVPAVGPLSMAPRKKKQEPIDAVLSPPQKARFKEVIENFDEFIAALRIFVEANGHTRVSPRYTLPDKDPVPEAFHKFKLGTRFAITMKARAILASEHPEKFEAMKALGVDFEDEMPEWDRIVLALTTYKEVTGGTKVSARFVCPAEAPWPRQVWGFRLGARITNIRNTGYHIKDHEDRVRQLDELGFEWRRTEIDESKVEPFETVLEALQFYKKILGDLSVQHAFVVPSVSPWPAHLQGLPLGQRVNAIRTRDLYVNNNPERIQQLNELGFIWSHREQNVEERFQLALEALKRYQAIHGDLDVPQTFRVPREEAWPEALWGMQLGNRVNSIRSHGTFVRNRPDRKAQLTALGFDWNAQKNEKVSKGRVLSPETRGEATEEAAPARKQPNPTDLPSSRDLLDSLSSADDDFDDEPEEQLELWQVADPLQDGKPIDGYEWIYDEFGGGWQWMDVLDAMKTYVEITGESDVHNMKMDFLCGGLEALGEVDPEAPFPDAYIPRLREMEHAAMQARIAEEEQMEMELDEDGEPPAEALMQLETGMSPEQEARQRQDSFEQDPRLARFRGLPLGIIVTRMRIGEILVKENKERMSQMKAFGIKFEFIDDEAYLGLPYTLLASGLLAFRKIRGHCFVPHDYVIPEAQPWPYPVRRMKLGLLVNQMRIKRDCVRKFHPGKWETLREFEFCWIPGRVEAGEEGTTHVGDYFIASQMNGDEEAPINFVLKEVGERRAAKNEQRRLQQEQKVMQAQLQAQLPPDAKAQAVLLAQEAQEQKAQKRASMASR
eukprot:CAMPEP_0118857158 /NCGR_PEP_ID=MMETSP1163-20130328/4374_1 /TAXON_ID=124430 /ORGANISM="Phaeomonas parva, Strain CCMP2877" /LENGTH=833 /DNA_ID=CAMNT_0006790419 /DNA_START=134 /DNA_END=2635 /DNA_ORIENTATION=+